MTPEQEQRLINVENQLFGNLLTSYSQFKDSSFKGVFNLVSRAALPTHCSPGDLTIRNGTLYYASATDTWVRVNGRVVVSITTASSYTIDTNTYNALSITALAGAINSISASGTPNNFDTLIVRIKDDGTARAITWDATKFVSRGVTLPTTTVISKVTTVGFIYNSVAAVWDCVALAQE